MALLIKAGIFGGLITSVVLPVAITSSTGTKSVGLLDLDDLLDEIQEPAPENSALANFYKAGYRKKRKERLADFNKDREAYIGGNFALGCHRLLFGGKNVPWLFDASGEWNVPRAGSEPMKDYLGNEDQPLLGCSTASVMTWSDKGNVYEFELAVKRGDRGFLERVTFWARYNMAISQLVVYRKEENPSFRGQYSWFNLYGIQRRITDTKDFEIGNPITGEWTDLKTDDSSINKHKYFSIWIEDPKEEQGEKHKKTILDGLGLRIKSGKRLFSSLDRANSQEEWFFKVFGTKSSSYPIEMNTIANHSRNYATYNSEIADEVASFRGIWKDVNKFCESQEGKEKGNLPHADAERLRDYCYTNQPKPRRKN